MDDVKVLDESDQQTQCSKRMLDPELAGAFRQLYGMLLMICKLSGLRLELTTPRGESAEAWEKLVQRNEPRTHQRALNQLVKLLNCDLSGDLEGKTLLWERMIKTQEEQTGKMFAEVLRVVVWLSSALESAIKTHMLMRTELTRWTDLRATMMSCTRAMIAPARVAPKPMDIGALTPPKGQEDKGKVNGKSSGKGGTPVSCEKCGKPGHTSDQCTSDPASSTCGMKDHRADKCWVKNSSTSNSAATPEKGETHRRKCFTCSKPGHLANSCPNKKKSLAAREHNTSPSQCGAGSLTALSVDDHDMVCVHM